MSIINLTRLFLLTTLFIANWLHAGQLSDIEQEVYNHLQRYYQDSYANARTEIKVKPLNQSLNLPRCRQPLTLTKPRGKSSRVSVKVSCSSPRWKLYASATRQHLLPVLVAARALQRGKILTADDMVLKETDITALKGAFYTDKNALIGWQVKRSTNRGKLLKPRSLSEAPVIRKGDSVIIEARRNSLSIRASGTALENGKKRQQIRVRNNKSGREIKAIVIAPGQVRTP
ncbi:flagellar basal body P-ring formation chaperone FlgA [Marinobacterium jannaschii]|uniref:flagellar basal body P-ring formation chaperone FlgA n=1 Tax=Marinobacterium jannaschii TaxID=64970 RepID=UPI000686AB45|nr:flagellar basal body P-ring formation chaperone FlgA [Marinobacterium jannaschii]